MGSTMLEKRMFLNSLGLPDPLRAPLPGPGSEPQGPGTRSPCHPEQFPNEPGPGVPGGPMGGSAGPPGASGTRKMGNYTWVFNT